MQRAQWEKWSAFGVIGSRGGRYLVWLDEFDVPHVAGRYRQWRFWPSTSTHAFCSVSATIWIPDSDRMLSWKLWIEGNERGFLAQANRLHYEPVPTDSLVKLTNQVLASQRSKRA